MWKRVLLPVASHQLPKQFTTGYGPSNDIAKAGTGNLLSITARLTHLAINVLLPFYH
jgi:hypothetical protein